MVLAGLIQMIIQIVNHKEQKGINMAGKVTEKIIKIHTHIDGIDTVEDTKVVISHKKLKDLGAKRRVYKSTKEFFYFIETNYEIIL